MMMRHPRQQLRGSPNQGISHGVQPLPESALHTVKDPLPARLTRPIHTTLLSPRVLTGTVLSPRLSCNHVAVEPFTKTEGVYLHRGCCSRPKNGRVPMRNDSVTSPLVPTEKPDSNLQDGIEEPRGSQEIGGTRFRLGMENCSQRQLHGFEPRTFFEAQGPRIICVKEAGKKQGRGRRLGDWEEITAAGRTSSERGYRGLVYLQLFPRRRKDQRCSKGS